MLTFHRKYNKLFCSRRKVGELGVNKKGTTLYSKEDIREQYCINDKELQVRYNLLVHYQLFKPKLSLLRFLTVKVLKDSLGASAIKAR